MNALLDDLMDALRELEGELILCEKKPVSPFARTAMARVRKLRKEIESRRASEQATGRRAA